MLMVKLQGRPTAVAMKKKGKETLLVIINTQYILAFPRRAVTIKSNVWATQSRKLQAVVHMKCCFVFCVFKVVVFMFL